MRDISSSKMNLLFSSHCFCFSRDIIIPFCDKLTFYIPDSDFFFSRRASYEQVVRGCCCRRTNEPLTYSQFIYQNVFLIFIIVLNLIFSYHGALIRPKITLGAVQVQYSRPIQDVVIDEYVLIVNQNEPPPLDLLEKKFRRIGASLRVVRLDGTEAIAVYGNDLLLVQPDLHIS